MIRSATLLAATLLLGCGETNIQAIRRLEPAYAAHRGELLIAAQRLPPPGGVLAWGGPASMSPPLVFDEGRTNDPHATVEILQLEDLVDVEAHGEARNQARMGLSIRSPLHFCLAWTGPTNPLSPDVWGDRGRLGEECEAALRRPWLVLIRTVEVRLPELLRMEAFIVHRPSRRLVGALPIDVLGHPARGDVGRSSGGDAIHSAFHEAASCELSLALSRLPGATIRLDRPGCEGRFHEIATPASLVKRVAAEP